MGTKISKGKYISKRYVNLQEEWQLIPDGSCLKYLDIGDPKSDKKGFSGADDIADWFKNDRSDDWRQRD